MELTIWRSLIEAHREEGRGLWYDPARKFLYWANEPFEFGHLLVLFAERLLPFAPETDDNVIIRIEIVGEQTDMATAMRIWRDAAVDVVALQQGQRLRAFGSLAHQHARWRLNDHNVALVAADSGWEVWGNMD